MFIAFHSIGIKSMKCGANSVPIGSEENIQWLSGSIFITFQNIHLIKQLLIHCQRKTLSLNKNIS